MEYSDSEMEYSDSEMEYSDFEMEDSDSQMEDSDSDSQKEDSNSQKEDSDSQKEDSDSQKEGSQKEDEDSQEDEDSEDQLMFIEDFIPGKFQKFLNNNGYNHFLMTVLPAFMHWSWCATNGNIMIGLEASMVPLTPELWAYSCSSSTMTAMSYAGNGRGQS